ncbi:unnamed protein product [Ambrosiozyma monospora]|uniref:Unnamed protein product n=1 Tax=Ambrosiozyma monospora TaxID=43982 RepID=A0A9W6YW22_AMBMO|nr:unnamed protein product [Ambrosiozyma monospora]
MVRLDTRFLYALNELFSLPITHLKRAGSLPKFPDRIAVSLSGNANSICLFHLLLNYKLQYQPTLKIIAVSQLDSVSPMPVTRLHEYIYQDLKKTWGNTVQHETVQIDSIDTNMIKNPDHLRLLKHESMIAKCEELGVDRIFMGDNMDDQLAVFMERLTYNSTVFGLMGMKPVSRYPFGSTRHNLKVIRPLLKFSENDIHRYCKENQLNWNEDGNDGHTYRKFYLDHLRAHPTNCQSPQSYLNKEAISQSFLETIKVGQYLQSRVDHLRKEMYQRQLCTFYKQYLSFKMILPDDIFERYTFLEIDRFIFESGFKISPSIHYCDGFTKFNSESQISSDILTNRGSVSFSKELFNQPLGITKSSLFLCTFEKRKYLNNSTGRFNYEIEIFKSKESRTSVGKADLAFPGVAETNSFSKWVLFDHRLYLRILCKTPKYLNKELYVSTYDAKIDGKELKKSLKFPNNSLKWKRMVKDLRKRALKYNLPILREKENNSFVCFPTMSLFPGSFVKEPQDLEVECQTKSDL